MKLNTALSMHHRGPCSFSSSYFPSILLTDTPQSLSRPSAVTMGFLRECFDMLLGLVVLNPYSDGGLGSQQKPLFDSTTHDAGTTVIEPVNASPNFQCVYPPRWKSCNTATTRDCWLQDTEAPDAFGAYSQVDIHTDCKRGRPEVDS